MKDIWLIRHAESEANTQREYIGGRATMSPLTDMGKQQARNLGHYMINLSAYNEDLKDLRTNTDFYSSNAVRAISTGRIAMEMLCVDPFKLIECNEFAELDQGDWEGEKRDSVYTTRVMELLRDQGVNFKPPNGESQKDVADRMFKSVILDVVCSSLSKDRVILFNHGLSIKTLMWKMFGFNDSQVYLGRINNCSITRFFFDEYADPERQLQLIWWNNNTQT